jgi:uncharacterized protein YbaR (Trm112 family)
VDAQLLEILVCPDKHHAPLTYDEAALTLTCTECRRVFEIRDGIPVLLLDEARPPAASDEARRPAAGDEARPAAVGDEARPGPAGGNG